MNPPPVYLRAPAIAARFGVSVRTVRRWIDKRILPSIKIGGARLVAEDALERALCGEGLDLEADFDAADQDQSAG
ncbi:MAG: helix-turn-helix domain-containing protein [Rhizobiales bacterium]|nr:helix-turn-helix domain-containing protein [Hyphomicrobiales bacterium]